MSRSTESDGYIVAEVLSAAEVRALQRHAPAEQSHDRPLPIELDPAELARLSKLARAVRGRTRRHGKAPRGSKRTRRAGQALESKSDPITAAIERAYERERELARRTPERFWTPAMREAVQRGAAK